MATFAELWGDLPLLSRAQVTDADFARVVRVALMEEGLLCGPAPVAAPEMPEIPTQAVWAVCWKRWDSNVPVVAFDSLDDAETAAQMLRDGGGFLPEKEWDLGNTMVLSDPEWVIEELQAPTRGDAEAKRAELVAWRKAQDAYEAATNARKETQEKAASLTQQLLTERAEAVAYAGRVEECRRTFKDYQELAGDDATARLFLARVFPAAVIADAIGVTS